MKNKINKKNNNEKKLTLKEKLLSKSFSGLCDKLIYACYIVSKKKVIDIDYSYEQYMLDVKDVLTNGVE